MSRQGNSWTDPWVAYDPWYPPSTQGSTGSTPLPPRASQVQPLPQAVPVAHYRPAEFQAALESSRASEATPWQPPSNWLSRLPAPWAQPGDQHPRVQLSQQIHGPLRPIGPLATTPLLHGQQSALPQASRAAHDASNGASIIPAITDAVQGLDQVGRASAEPPRPHGAEEAVVGHRTSPEADAQDRPRASESSSPVGLTGVPNSAQRSATPTPVGAALVPSKEEGDSPFFRVKGSVDPTARSRQSFTSVRKIPRISHHGLPKVRTLLLLGGSLELRWLRASASASTPFSLTHS